MEVRKTEGKLYVYDIVRRKYVRLVPEEWVRQHMVHYLLEELVYPKALIRIETGLRYHRLQKRSDVVVFDNSGAVYMLIECKAPTVRIDQGAMDQLSVYNQQYKARYLALTNGLRHYVVRMDYGGGNADAVGEFPPYRRA